MNKRKSKYGISYERSKEFEYYIKRVKCINDTVLDSSNKENADDLFKQGMPYYNDKQYENSIKCLKKAIELHSNSVKNLEWIGNSYNKNGQFKEAKNAYANALEIDFDNNYYKEQFKLNEDKANGK